MAVIARSWGLLEMRSSNSLSVGLWLTAGGGQLQYLGHEPAIRCTLATVTPQMTE
jgi:hypothetical protein